MAKDITDILNILPHRYPFLLLDAILEENPGEVVGIKNVSMNEPFFTGHFPSHPIMPGVLIVEAMAQTGAILILDAIEEPEKKLAYFMSIDQVKFRKPVVPGDQIQLEVSLIRSRASSHKMAGKAYVAGELVCEAELMAGIVNR